MALLCLRPIPSRLSLLPSASASSRVTLLHLSKCYFSGLRPKRLFRCRGRAARHQSEDDYDYVEEEEEGFGDDGYLYDDLLESEEEFNSDSDTIKFDISDNKKLRKDHNRRQPRSNYGKKDEDIIIDIDDDNKGKVPKKKAKSRVGVSSKKDLIDLGSMGEPKHTNFSRKRFESLQKELNFDSRWYPLVNYLSTYGLNESHFTSMFERHMRCFHTSLTCVREKMVLLTTIGVKMEDMKRILVRQPQILEYSVENLYAHVQFLVSIGVPSTKLGHVIAAAPSFFSYSIEKSLKPTIKYLIEEVGIKESDIGKVVQLSPQILVLPIDRSWKSRLFFFSRELGAPKYNIVRMVTKHPQFLHYSIEDGILPRINFLRSIGMKDAEILKVLTNLAQVLSLSLEGNLRPKYNYFVNELRNEVNTLTKYPVYLSLSLEQRIRPRHCFLISLKKAPQNGPFPIGSLVPRDESFCKQWAGTSVDAYLKFRERLLLSDFAPQQERKAIKEPLRSVSGNSWRREETFKEPQQSVSGSSWRKEVVKSGYW
ncbi:mitochondrial transcription termination factor family protein isoform X2 [Carex rostrata]